MTVYFISDLHLGHKAILQHTAGVPGAWRGGQNVQEHDEWVLEQLHSVPSDKRTVWWFLGDVAMDIGRLPLIDTLPGRKRLVLGNHDLFQTGVYLKYFEWVCGTIKKYKFWISHCPLHETELRGLTNLHGHCHHNQLADNPRYLNCAIEWLPNHKPLSLEQVREIFSNKNEEISI